MEGNSSFVLTFSIGQAFQQLSKTMKAEKIKQKAESKKQKAESRKQKAESRKQKAERQKAERQKYMKT